MQGEVAARAEFPSAVLDRRSGEVVVGPAPYCANCSMMSDGTAGDAGRFTGFDSGGASGCLSGVRPVYVSPGHRIGTTQATDLVLALSPSCRLPDPLRHADHISRRALAAGAGWVGTLWPSAYPVGGSARGSWRFDL